MYIHPCSIRRIEVNQHKLLPLVVINPQRSHQANSCSVISGLLDQCHGTTQGTATVPSDRPWLGDRRMERCHDPVAPPYRPLARRHVLQHHPTTRYCRRRLRRSIPETLRKAAACKERWRLSGHHPAHHQPGAGKRLGQVLCNVLLHLSVRVLPHSRPRNHPHLHPPRIQAVAAPSGRPSAILGSDRPTHMPRMRLVAEDDGAGHYAYMHR